MNRTLRINGGELYCYYSPESSGVGNVTDIIPRVTGLFQKYGICREIYRSLPTVYFRFFIQSDVLFLTSDPVVPVVGVVGLLIIRFLWPGPLQRLSLISWRKPL